MRALRPVLTVCTLAVLSPCCSGWHLCEVRTPHMEPLTSSFSCTCLGGDLRSSHYRRTLRICIPTLQYALPQRARPHIELHRPYNAGCAQGLTPPLHIINIIKPKRGDVRHLCFTVFCVSTGVRHLCFTQFYVSAAVRHGVHHLCFTALCGSVAACATSVFPPFACPPLAATVRHLRFTAFCVSAAACRFAPSHTTGNILNSLFPVVV